MKLGILKSETGKIHENWAIACKKHNLEYQIIDLTASEWLEIIMKTNFSAFLACPPGSQTHLKQLYDERINIIENSLNYFVYPSYKEILLHENKKFLAYWLKANNIDHPSTHVFYIQDEAMRFAHDCELPVVGKFNIGASGRGVQVFRERNKLYEYIKLAFSKGLRQSWGPNLKMGSNYSRIVNVIKNPAHLAKRLKTYNKLYNEIQKGFVILQEFVHHEFEWRIVKIGNSFFAHKKIKQGDKASGTKGITYDLPSNHLLDHINNISDVHGFNSMAVDLFETDERNYLINELQCAFGHIQEHICEKNGKPGRLIYDNQQWSFEEGLFNANLSYDLRLEHVLQILKTK